MAAGRVTRLRAGAADRWAALKRRYTWLRHVVAAWDLLQRNNGGQYAAAITFFSFLALFPLLLLVAAVTGFVLHSHPGAEQTLYNHLTDNVPGPLGQTIKHSLQAAIASRTGIGVVGLVGVLLSGLGWIGNLRGAVDGVWGRTPPKMNFVMAKLANLVVLAGLGIAGLVSVGLTVIGTSLTDQILRAIGLEHVAGGHAVLKLLGIALAVVGDTLIFWWVLVRLPQRDVPARIAVRGALLAAVGFEVLKVIGTYTIAHTANSPTAGPFASLLGVLIWIQLVARWLLFACAWTAVVSGEYQVAVANKVPVAEPPAMAEATPTPEINPVAVGATLVGAGMVAGAAAGAAATLAVTRHRPRD